MSSFEKRAKEDKRNQKARAKAQRRMEKRNAPPSTGSEFITVAEIVGNVRSVDEVMRSLQMDATAPRSAPTVPTKLFVGSLSNETTSAALRAHFERTHDGDESLDRSPPRGRRRRAPRGKIVTGAAASA
jgi:hypothetical protein